MGNSFRGPHEALSGGPRFLSISAGVHHAMRLRRIEDVSAFLEQVWNDPTERFDVVVPMPLQDFCMVSVHCQIWTVIYASRKNLQAQLGETAEINGFVPVRNALINDVIKFMEEKTGIASNYSLPESNPKFVTRLEGPKKII